MKPIVLLTDFGLKDSFVGVMKGVIVNISPGAEIVDLTHQVMPCNINQAAFLLLTSFKFFPKGTIFVVVVDPGVGSNRKSIAIKTKDYYFVGPDNGVLSLAAISDSIGKIVSLDNKEYFLEKVSATFHGRDIFAPVAAYLEKGVKINSFGKELKNIKGINLPVPEMSGNKLTGEIIFIDRFGNLVTNITKDKLKEFVGERKFRISIKSAQFDKLYNYYSEAEENELFLCEGGFGFLEISLKNKSAAELLKAEIGDKVSVNFAG